VQKNIPKNEKLNEYMKTACAYTHILSNEINKLRKERSLSFLFSSLNPCCFNFEKFSN